MRSFFRRAAFFWWVTANRKKWAAEVYRQSQKFILKFQNKLRFLRSWRGAKLSILRKIGEVAFPRGNTLKDLLLRRWQEKKSNVIQTHNINNTRHVLYRCARVNAHWMNSNLKKNLLRVKCDKCWTSAIFASLHPKYFSESTDIEYFLFSTLQESNSGPWDVDNTPLGR